MLETHLDTYGAKLDTNHFSFFPPLGGFPVPSSRGEKELERERTIQDGKKGQISSVGESKFVNYIWKVMVVRWI